MISSWRRRRAGRRGKKGQPAAEEDGSELVIPGHFRCPITLDLMKDPVTLSSGITYDRESIERWLEAGGHRTCPVTNRFLATLEPIPNHTIRKMIQEWCVAHGPHGVERIPTPRTPVTSAEVGDILSDVAAARDPDHCAELAAKIRSIEKESERNRRCLVANGAPAVLSSSFERFSPDVEGNAVVLKEILSALTGLFPLDQEAAARLGSAPSLRCLARLLMSDQDLSSRKNAVLVLSELLSWDNINSGKEKASYYLAAAEGACEGLFKLVKEPICPATSKASLAVLFQMVSSPNPAAETTAEKLVEMGLVSALLELLVSSDRSVSEKALGVLDGVCGGAGRDGKAYSHALMVPVLVKKVLRVSDAATEFAVSILWKLGKNDSVEEGEGGGEGVIDEALQVGGFQKLLLVLQVGCGGSTKEKATDLLKMMNLRKNRMSECVGSMDFKYVKRPF